MAAADPTHNIDEAHIHLLDVHPARALPDLAFFALVTPLMPMLGTANEVTAIIGLVAQVAIVLPLAVTLGAIASQLSASIADSIGASGLLHAISAKRIAIRHTYPPIGLIGAVIVWELHVNELITLASRAFALFYATQCIVRLASRVRDWQSLSTS